MSGLESSKRLDPVQRAFEEGRGHRLARDPRVEATAFDTQDHSPYGRRALGDGLPELVDMNKRDPLAALRRNPDDPFVREWARLYLTGNPYETSSFKSHRDSSGIEEILARWFLADWPLRAWTTTTLSRAASPTMLPGGHLRSVERLLSSIHAFRIPTWRIQRQSGHSSSMRSDS